MARILVVDDERNVRTTVALALEREGFEVDCAESGEEAVDRVRDGAYDLVITDCRLRGISGMDVLDEVKRSAPETEVVMMTAFGTIEGAVEAMRRGAFHYLRKPFQSADVVEVARGAVEARAPASELDLRSGPERASAFEGIVGRSKPIRELLELVAKVADTDSTVLITGETGTGKELVGRAIHAASRRAGRVFCAVNSAAFPETLLESELFGHRRGAFTGASTHKKGLFEHAHQGTVFLDEVAEMPLSMQAKLLRFLQTGEIRPVGGETTRVVDVRLVTATNKELEKEVEAGRFREDLYYRLAVIPLQVPPLRERTEDIPLLVDHFLRRFSAKVGKSLAGIEPEAMEVLQSYSWPGNVRELENTIERGVALCRGPRITLEDIPARLRSRPAEASPQAIQSLQSLERAHILRTLDQVGWNRKRAAELLEISTTTLWRRLKEFGIDGDRAASGARARP